MWCSIAPSSQKSWRYVSTSFSFSFSFSFYTYTKKTAFGNATCLIYDSLCHTGYILSWLHEGLHLRHGNHKWKRNRESPRFFQLCIWVSLLRRDCSRDSLVSSASKLTKMDGLVGNYRTVLIWNHVFSFCCVFYMHHENHFLNFFLVCFGDWKVCTYCFVVTIFIVQIEILVFAGFFFCNLLSYFFIWQPNSCHYDILSLHSCITYKSFQPLVLYFYPSQEITSNTNLIILKVWK